MGVDSIGWHFFNCLALCHSLMPAPDAADGKFEEEEAARAVGGRVHGKGRGGESAETDLGMGAGAKEGCREVDEKELVELYIGDPLEIATFAGTNSLLEVSQVPRPPTLGRCNVMQGDACIALLCRWMPGTVALTMLLLLPACLHVILLLLFAAPCLVQERRVETSQGRTLATAVVTLRGSRARMLRECARSEGLLVRDRAREGAGRNGADEFVVLDQVVDQGLEQGVGSECRDTDMQVAEADSHAALARAHASPACTGAEGEGEEGGAAGERDSRRDEGSGGDKGCSSRERAAVLRRFAFTSEALRSCVIVAFENVVGTYVYVKGAPEVMADLCDQATVPRDISEQVSHHTLSGRRVLACAYRTCDAMQGAEWAFQAERSEVETNLRWAGLIVMENMLKADSKSGVEELMYAGLECAMVTGDHALTAISVARRCGILVPSRPVLLAMLVGEEQGAGGAVKSSHTPCDQQAPSPQIPPTKSDKETAGLDLFFVQVSPSPGEERATRRDEARKEAGARAGVGKERMSLREAHARLVAGEQVEVAVTGLARSRAC